MPCRRRWVFMPGPHRPVRHDLRLVPILRRFLAVLAATAVGIGLAHAGQKPDKPPSCPSANPALLAKLEDDKLHGTAESEQVWIDFKIIDEFNWRAAGYRPRAIGYINEHHETDGFLPRQSAASVQRPHSLDLEGAGHQRLRPADRRALRYDPGEARALFRGRFRHPYRRQYGAGRWLSTHRRLECLGFAQPVKGDFRQLSNDVAIVGQLSYRPPALPGFNGSVSAYYTPR
jgi:hypothetical protein